MTFFEFCGKHGVSKTERVALAMHLASYRAARTFHLLAGVTLR